MEILHYQFMQNALVAAVLVSIACGIVGTFVVTKRMVFISGGISHAAFGGVGLGYLAGVSPMAAAVPFSLAAAVAMGLVAKRARLSEDTAIGMLWTVGMALGIIFINLSPGYAPDLMGYLFGNILTVPATDLRLMLALDFVIIASVIAFWREFVAIAFDEEYAAAAGVPARALYLLMLCLVALSIVVLMRVAGIILVIALLTMPVAIARQYTHEMKRLMALSVLTGVVITLAGLWLSFAFDLASGATIVLVLALFFVISTFITRRRRRSAA